MMGKITLGVLIFMIIFAATGLVLLNEGVLPNQQDTASQPGTGRMQIETRAQSGRSIEQGALIFFNNCRTCHGDNGEGIPGKGPSLNPGVFKHFNDLKTQKLFNGTLADFIMLTVAAGRPVQSTYAQSLGGFANPMPTWSQQFGGPLRDADVANVVNFVLNWQAEAQGAAGPPASFKPAGSDLTTPLPAGNAAHGKDLFTQVAQAGNNAKLPCAACHSLNPGEIKVGPSLAGIATTAASREPGKTAEQYIRESIQMPNAFIVPGNPKFLSGGKSLMPEGLGNQMTAQDLADVIAYLLTLK